MGLTYVRQTDAQLGQINTPRVQINTPVGQVTSVRVCGDEYPIVSNKHPCGESKHIKSNDLTHSLESCHGNPTADFVQLCLLPQ